MELAVGLCDGIVSRVTSLPRGLGLTARGLLKDPSDLDELVTRSAVSSNAAPLTPLDDTDHSIQVSR